jgi:hypothetical protein
MDRVSPYVEVLVELWISNLGNLTVGGCPTYMKQNFFVNGVARACRQLFANLRLLFDCKGAYMAPRNSGVA